MKNFYTIMLSALILVIGAGALTSNAVNSDDAPVAYADDEIALTLINSYPTDGTTLADWEFTKVARFRFSGDIEILRNGEAIVQIAVPRAFGGGFSVQKEIPASDMDNLYINPANAAELWVNLTDFEFDTFKNYSIILQKGLVSSNGVSNAECSTSFQLFNTPIYTTSLASGTTLTLPSELENITISFSANRLRMMYSEDNVLSRPKVNLYKVEGATRQRIGSYDTELSNTTIKLTYAGETPEEVKAPAYYEIVVPSGFVMFEDSDGFSAGTSSTIEITDLKFATGTIEWAEITDYINLVQPVSFEVNPTNAGSIFADAGLGALRYSLATLDFFGIDNSAPITYTYSATEDGPQELLNSFNSTDGEKVVFGNRGGLDDSGLIEFPVNGFMFLSMVTNADGDIDPALVPPYQREGYYTLTIPDGAFMAEGKMLKGTVLKYHYTSEIPGFDIEYTLTPADGATIKDASEVFGINGSGIILEFKGANIVDYRSKPATLECPDGTILNRVAPANNQKDKITWTFGTKDTEWPDGTYKFVIEKGKIGVDMGWMDDWAGDGNFNGLTAIYKADRETSGIILVGVERADTYTVYTLGGVQVKNNVKADSLLDLDPGMYIVNGKKALIRK